MGKKFPPVFSNIFLTDLETLVLASAIKNRLYFYTDVCTISGVHTAIIKGGFRFFNYSEQSKCIHQTHLPPT